MSSAPGLLSLQCRAGHPDFLDLPWHLPFAEWKTACTRRVEVFHGTSRHVVEFVSYGSAIYALKELPPAIAAREHDALVRLEERRLPAVLAVGHARCALVGGASTSVLVTRFLDGSLPYRLLFQQVGLERYRDRLLDAMAGLLVRLHLAGFYWGDCSLSNTLFRRDAGELQAYLVDAETSDFPEAFGDGHRKQDLLVLQENVAGELAELVALEGALPTGLTPAETGIRIRQRYDGLWAEVTREETFGADERWRMHERVAALNALGFSVGEIELVPEADGNRLRMRTLVTDREWHRDQLHGLAGVVAEERQAQQMLNEIRQMKAWYSAEQNRSVSMAEAAYAWERERWEPTLRRLASQLEAGVDPAELYCQVLEHKWFLSEREQHDVGIERALDDYLRRFSPDPPAGRSAIEPAQSPG